MLHHLRLWLKAVLVLVLVALLVPLLLSQAPATPKRYALVVGINEYEHADLADLKVAENDAKVLSKELEALGYQVVRLVGKEATKVAIEKSLRDLCEKARKGDLVLVALSGHGMQFEATDVACFCPVDARPFKEKAATLVSMATVYRELKSSLASDKLLLIDACRNDPNVRGRSGIEAESAPVPFGLAALYACAPGQKANEDDKLGHGLFMHAVLAGLRGAARDPETGEVDFSSLSRYVQKATPAQAALLPGSPKQTPTLEARYVAAPVLVPKSNVVVEAKPLKAPFGEKEIREARAAWAKKLGMPEKKTLDLGDGVTMDLVLIPPGVFLMGSPETEKKRGEEKQHEVALTQPFYMAVTETTQAQYRAITDANPSHHTGDNLPVDNVTWFAATAFCDALGKKTGTKVSLPSEAQWEYACRAGTTSVFHFGDVLNGENANCDGKFGPYGTTTRGLWLEKPTPAGDARYPANEFGLRDMHGNVWEWCQDGYVKDYEGLPRKDPLAGQQTENRRVKRGGTWLNYADACRAASRYRYEPWSQSPDTGFRFVVLP